MKITIHKTNKCYHDLLNLPRDLRLDFYKNKLMGPFMTMYETTGIEANPDKLGLLSLTQNDSALQKSLEVLEEADAWSLAKEALETGLERFKKEGIELPDEIVLGLYIGAPQFLAHSKGITGFGGIPGYIQILIDPTPDSLQLLPSVIVHELHHNVLFYHAKWNFMDVTLAKYLAVEGLAESFAESIYGEQHLGPWVTSLQGHVLDTARRLLGQNLEVYGFQHVQRYMFGDPHVEGQKLDVDSVPAFAGYAVGYHAVQAYLKRSGVSIESATLIEGEEIMIESGYFD